MPEGNADEPTPNSVSRPEQVKEADEKARCLGVVPQGFRQDPQDEQDLPREQANAILFITFILSHVLHLVLTGPQPFPQKCLFDDIGNRDVTGGRAAAVSDYTANRLNQYTQRTVPNKVDVLGIANPTAGVTVSIVGGSSYTANRKGEYFHWPLTVANSTAQYPTVSVVSQYGGDPDSGKVFVPPATESYTPDPDGNLTQDARWDLVWDGENRLVKLRSRSGSPAPERRLEFEYDWQGRRIRQKRCQSRLL